MAGTFHQSSYVHLNIYTAHATCWRQVYGILFEVDILMWTCRCRRCVGSLNDWLMNQSIRYLTLQPIIIYPSKHWRYPSRRNTLLSSLTECLPLDACHCAFVADIDTGLINQSITQSIYQSIFDQSIEISHPCLAWQYKKWCRLSGTAYQVWSPREHASPSLA